MDATSFGYTPAFQGYGSSPNNGQASVIAPDGTLSLASVARAVQRVLQNQAQNINQLQQQQQQAGGDGQGAQGAGGQGSATMLQMQAKVGEYTTSLQQGSSIMSGLSDTHKSIAQATK